MRRYCSRLALLHAKRFLFIDMEVLSLALLCCMQRQGGIHLQVQINALILGGKDAEVMMSPCLCVHCITLVYKQALSFSLITTLRMQSPEDIIPLGAKQRCTRMQRQGVDDPSTSLSVMYKSNWIQFNINVV